MEATKAERAKNLRYKKGIAAGFNINDIIDGLSEISGECDDIRYITEGDEDTLIAALDGNEDEAYEFRMMFSDLDCECQANSIFSVFFCEIILTFRKTALNLHSQNGRNGNVNLSLLAG